MSDVRKIVVFVISDLEFGGAQRQVVELCNHMDPERYEVHLCSLSDYVPLADGLRIGADRLHIVSRKGKWDVSVVPRLKRLLQSINADVVQAYLFDALISCRLAGGFAGTPLVVDSERNCDGSFKIRHRIAYRLTRGRVDLVIANSTAGSEFNRREHGLPGECYRVVHNGVNTERFRPVAGMGIRDELGIPDEELVVGMFASFKPQKNHELFLRVMGRVRKEVPEVRVLLVGDELHGGGSDSVAQKEMIRGWISEYGLENCCTCVGNREDVERVYPACDLTVLSSLFEGTPNVALESMACGVPVVATDVSDNAQVIPDGRVGYVVPLEEEDAMADRILRILRDSSLRHTMGDAAREWVEEEFSCRRLAEKTADVYDEGLALKGA